MNTNKILLNFDDGQNFELRNIRPLVGVAGLYFIYNTEIKIRYPNKESKLIYVGMSERKTNSIGRRLQNHLEGVSGNAGITNYIKANPVMFTYINFEMLKRQWHLNIESLESFFILSFVNRYGVYPICNNKSGYEILKMNLNVDFEINWEHFE